MYEKLNRDGYKIDEDIVAKLNEDYDHGFLIRRFFTEVLDLQGSELLVYALIYSFTIHTESSGYIGGLDYISRVTGVSRSSVARALNSLAEKYYILKKELAKKYEKHKYIYIANIVRANRMRKKHAESVIENLPRFPGVEEDDIGLMGDSVIPLGYI